MFAYKCVVPVSKVVWGEEFARGRGWSEWWSAERGVDGFGPLRVWCGHLWLLCLRDSQFASCASALLHDFGNSFSMPFRYRFKETICNFCAMHISFGSAGETVRHRLSQDELLLLPRQEREERERYLFFRSSAARRNLISWCCREDQGNAGIQLGECHHSRRNPFPSIWSLHRPLFFRFLLLPLLSLSLPVLSFLFLSWLFKPISVNLLFQEFMWSLEDPTR